MNVMDKVQRLRDSTLIKEKIYGDVSSFNFTRDAFYNSRWNALTTKARGLFINTKSGEIVTRGYDKFFNIDENQNNKRTVLKKKLAFPVHAYRKENGFLGLISWDRENDCIRFATKSCLEGKYVDMLRNAYWDSVCNPEMAEKILKENDYTILVEVIDPYNDPHIIEYSRTEIVVLDMMTNEWDSERLPYQELASKCSLMGLTCKELWEKYETWVDLEAAINEWISEDYLEDGNHVEGYVVVDQNGFMFKVKTGYYTKWKRRRSKAQKILTAHQIGENDAEDSFLSWVYANANHLSAESSIIELRNKFEEAGAF